MGSISNKVQVDATAGAGAAGGAAADEGDDGAAAGTAPDGTPLRRRAARSMLHRVAWNHSEFLVEYPSLAQELRVADQYLRIFLDSGARK